MVRTGAGQHMAGRDPHNLMVYLFLRVPCVCVCKSRYRRVRRTAHLELRGGCGPVAVGARVATMADRDGYSRALSSMRARSNPDLVLSIKRFSCILQRRGVRFRSPHGPTPAPHTARSRSGPRLAVGDGVSPIASSARAYIYIPRPSELSVSGPKAKSSSYHARASLTPLPALRAPRLPTRPVVYSVAHLYHRLPTNPTDPIHRRARAALSHRAYT